MFDISPPSYFFTDHDWSKAIITYFVFVLWGKVNGLEESNTHVVRSRRVHCPGPLMVITWTGRIVLWGITLKHSMLNFYKSGVAGFLQFCIYTVFQHNRGMLRYKSPRGPEFDKDQKDNNLDSLSSSAQNSLSNFDHTFSPTFTKTTKMSVSVQAYAQWVTVTLINSMSSNTLSIKNASLSW